MVCSCFREKNHIKVENIHTTGKCEEQDQDSHVYFFVIPAQELFMNSPKLPKDSICVPIVPIVFLGYSYCVRSIFLVRSDCVPSVPSWFLVSS